MFLLAFTVALAQDPIAELHRFTPSQRRLTLSVDEGSVEVRTDRTLDHLEVSVLPHGPCVVGRGEGVADLDVAGCRADVVVTAPAGAALRIDLAAGDVRLATDARLVLAVGTGNVSGTARGPVRVSVGTGDVRLDGLTRPPTVAVATGSTELSYAADG